VSSARTAGVAATTSISTAREGTLAGWIPGDAVAVSETHDLGRLLVALVSRARAAGAGGGGDTAALAGPAANADALAGWLGDGALILRPGEAGVVGLVEDASAATATLRQLRGIATLLAGGRITFGSEAYAGGEIVTAVFDSTGGTLAERMRHSVSWSLQGGRFIAGSSAAFVKAVLDTTPADALAAKTAYRDALARAGAANVASTYLDPAAYVALLTPLVPEADRADFERVVTPVVEHLGSAAGAALAGDPLRVRFVLIVR
jgi:hypothetical protein